MPAFITFCGYYTTPAAGRSRRRRTSAQLSARLSFYARVYNILRILYHTCGGQNAQASYLRLAGRLIGLKRPRLWYSVDIIPYPRPATHRDRVFLLSEFQRPEGAIRVLRPDLVWSATGGSDPRFTCRLSLLIRCFGFVRGFFQSRP